MNGRIKDHTDLKIAVAETFKETYISCSKITSIVYGISSFIITYMPASFVSSCWLHKSPS